MGRYRNIRGAGLKTLAAALFTLSGGTALAEGGTTLPASQGPFTGKIGETYVDSTPVFPTPVRAPLHAPNVLLILTDDVGFGASSTFGGLIPTPNFDRLATRGLVYNRFHTTAMCSPTRAALLTGRNHHAVGNGIVANFGAGFPGYNNMLPKSAATIAEVLRQNGYSTAMFGKHHNTPEPAVSPAGPFDLWPTGLGFEYFYGFMAGETNQFTPALYRGTTPIPTLTDGVLEKALTDDAIHWIHTQKAAAPDKPFFVYYASPAIHAPIQVPADWIGKFKGKFDKGWDVLRAEIVARQKRLGIIPANTESTPRPAGIKPWKDLTSEEQRVNARFMEVYAAMLAYQDAQFGRLLDELDRMGESDNTLIMFIEGDNGAAAEGGAIGSSNATAAWQNGMKESTAMLVANLQKIGGPEAVANPGFGWGWATNAPFSYVKQIASHLGGTRNGLVVSWPNEIKARGIRPQFTHVIDVAPTILQTIGIKAPDIVNGVSQQPVDGISFAYSFGALKAPERPRTQYFEMMGNRAIYQNGWMASTTPVDVPWSRSSGAVLPTQYKWELYDLDKDYAQAHDLAAKYPDKLKEMQVIFRQEADRNQVWPLDNRRNRDRLRGSEALLPKRSNYTYWGPDISLPTAIAAPLFDRGFRITADVDVPRSDATGVIVALGSKFGGWSFYVKDGRPVALMAASQLVGDQSKIEATESLASGPVKLSYDFSFDGSLHGGGTMVISANGRVIARGRVARTISMTAEYTDTLDIGFDASTPVTNEYTSGGRWPGAIRRVDIAVGQPGVAGGVR